MTESVPPLWGDPSLVIAQPSSIVVFFSVGSLQAIEIIISNFWGMCREGRALEEGRIGEDTKGSPQDLESWSLLGSVLALSWQAFKSFFAELSLVIKMRSLGFIPLVTYHELSWKHSLLNEGCFPSLPPLSYIFLFLFQMAWPVLIILHWCCSTCGHPSCHPFLSI